MRIFRVWYPNAENRRSIRIDGELFDEDDGIQVKKSIQAPRTTPCGLLEFFQSLWLSSYLYISPCREMGSFFLIWGIQQFINHVRLENV